MHFILNYILILKTVHFVLIMKLYVDIKLHNTNIIIRFKHVVDVSFIILSFY